MHITLRVTHWLRVALAIDPHMTQCIWLHAPINFSIGYNGKRQKVIYLLHFPGLKSDPNFDGMRWPPESATDPETFMSSSPPWKFASLFCIWQLGNSSYTGQNLEWPTDSLYRSTKPSSSLQNLLLSGFLLLQGLSIAWNKQNSADIFTLHCLHHRFRTLNFYLVLLYIVPKQCDVNSSLVPYTGIKPNPEWELPRLPA